jgi:hypothetical protein
VAESSLKRPATIFSTSSPLTGSTSSLDLTPSAKKSHRSDSYCYEFVGALVKLRFIVSPVSQKFERIFTLGVYRSYWGVYLNLTRLSVLRSPRLARAGAILLIIVVSSCSHSFGPTFEPIELGECPFELSSRTDLRAA